MQVCLDAGEAAAVPSRWAAAARPRARPLVALFANSRRHAGADTRWASARLRSVLRHLPTRHPAAGRAAATPPQHWARLAMEAPVHLPAPRRRARGPRRPG